MLNYVYVTLYIYEHISMFTQLYSPRYTQSIKLYIFSRSRITYTIIYIFLCFILKIPKMNLAVDLTHSFDINTMNLKSSSL